MVVQQGEIYWVDMPAPAGSEPGFKRPFVVVQNDIFNQSQIQTLIVCALTSNLKRGKAPGNVTLKKGEAGLSKASVVNISQLLTIDKQMLGSKIGRLSALRLTEIIQGIHLITEPV